MRPKRLAAFALVALVVVNGAAAVVPGHMSAGAGNDAPIEPDEHADDEAAAGDAPGRNANGARDANRGPGTNGSAGAKRGPSADVPARAPDHVREIHDAVRRFLPGDLDGSLGAVVRDVVGSDGAAAASGGVR